MEKLKNQWDNTQHSVDMRQNQLQAMLTDSTKWEELRKELQSILDQTDFRLYTLIQTSKDTLVKQLAENKVNTGWGSRCEEWASYIMQRQEKLEQVDIHRCWLSVNKINWTADFNINTIRLSMNNLSCIDPTPLQELMIYLVYRVKKSVFFLPFLAAPALNPLAVSWLSFLKALLNHMPFADSMES